MINLKNKTIKLKTDYIWFFGLFLFSISFMNLGGYIMIAVIALYLLFNLKKIEINIIHILLLLFSITYFLFYSFYFPVSSKEIICYLIVPVGAFLMCEILVRYSDNPNILFWLFFIITFGFLAHGMLNFYAYQRYLYNGSYIGRVAYDFWRRQIISVTGNGLYFTLALSLSVGALFSKIKLFYKIIAVSAIIFSLVNSILFAHRTSIIIFIILLVYGSVLWFANNKIGNISKIIAILLLFAILIVFFIMWNLNSFGLRDAIISSDIYKRFFLAKETNSDNRLIIWVSFFKQFLYYPFGGSEFSLYKNNSWVHNFWLDIYYKVGVVPFVLAIIITVLFVIYFIKICREFKSNENVIYNPLIRCFLLGIFMNMFVEPIMDANPYFYISILMIFGGIYGYNLRAKSLGNRLINQQRLN